jgi:flagellin
MINISSASALISANALNSATSDANKASERISTTLRINRASDDPVGMVKAMKLKTDITSFTKAMDNINSGIEIVDNVETTLTSIYDVLAEMKTLADLAVTETDTDTLAAYQVDIESYLSDISNLIEQVTLDGSTIMDGDTSMTIQVGINSTDTRTFTFDDVTTSTLGVDDVDISDGNITSTDATDAVSAISAAMSTVTDAISNIAASQNSLDISASFANAMSTHKTIAYGKIMDADIAKETSNLAAAQVRQNASAAMLAQSNSMNKEIVTYLLRGFTQG